MRYIFTAIILMFFSTLGAQNVNLAWAKNISSTSSVEGKSVGVDALGNVYTTGYFSGTEDFDPGAGTYNLISFGVNDIFISKLDASGNFVWAKNMGGASVDVNSSCIAVDASGNVYTTGVFHTGTADFDPGPGIYNLTSTGDGSFISKLDASGNFVWAKNIGTGTSDFIRSSSITVDSSGNVYTTGNFSGTEDFDPGAGTYNLTSFGVIDIFISKLDASGNFVWAKNMGGVSGDVSGFSITVDAPGNVYTTGRFFGTVDFDPGPGTYSLSFPGVNNVFISKLDVSGNFVWAKSMDADPLAIIHGNSIAVDTSGNVYTTGDFQGTADFDPGPGIYTITSAGAESFFISKLDASGNFVWAKNMGGIPLTVGYSITTDASGNVYTTGQFGFGTVDFDPGPDTYDLTSSGNTDIFISKLNASGNFVWAKNIGGAGPSSVAGNSIVVDASGNVYVTGSFSDTVDFDPGPDTYNLVSDGFTDIFILKLSQNAVLPVTLTNIKAYQKNQGVVVEWITRQENNISRYEIERSQNGQQFSRLASVKSKGNSSTGLNYNLFDPNPFKGINFYRLKIIDNSEQTTNSPIVKVNFISGVTLITVHPNPVIGNTIVLEMKNLRKGIYYINLTNKPGQQLATKKIEHPGGSVTELIKPSKALSAGVYQLNLKGVGLNITNQVIVN